MHQLTAKDVLKFANEKGVKMVDLKFCDMIGTWQHLTVPLHQMTDETFENGFGSRRQLYSWMERHRRIRHDYYARSDDCENGSLHANADSFDHLRCVFARDSTALQSRSSPSREKSHRLHAIYRYRRHGLFWA